MIKQRWSWQTKRLSANTESVIFSRYANANGEWEIEVQVLNQILSSVLSRGGISIGYISADDPSIVGLNGFNRLGFNYFCWSIYHDGIMVKNKRVLKQLRRICIISTTEHTLIFNPSWVNIDVVCKTVFPKFINVNF